MSTKIEWADHTINPVVGCSKCSPGCDNCYAEKMAYRLSKMPATAAKYAGVVDVSGKWTGEINMGTTRDDPHRVPGKNKRVFVGSMTDIFHPSVRQDLKDEIFASMLSDHIFTDGHKHTFMLLTKRADRMREYFLHGPDAMLRRWGRAGDGWIFTDNDSVSFSEYAEGMTIPGPDHKKYPNLLHEYLWPLPNVWMGVTVCNASELHKLDTLRSIPAARRFVSFEPLLGDLGTVDFTGIDWVICGGETGPNSRPMHPDWVRSLRDQCQAAGVPFFFKSWGDFFPVVRWADWDCRNKGLMHYYPAELWTVKYSRSRGTASVALDGSDPVREKGSAKVDDNPDVYAMRYIGKHPIGKRLDGELHNAFPPYAPGSFMADLPF